MNTVLALAALVLGAFGAPVHEQSAPKGLYFVVPSAPAQQQQEQQHISPEQVEDVMTQLRQEDGSDSGVYHIVLPDGRLQRVEFSTAPVSSQVQAEEAQQEDHPAGPAALVAYVSGPPKAAPVKEAAEVKVAGPSALLAQLPRPAPVRSEEVVQLTPDSRIFLVAQPAEAAQLQEAPAQSAQLNEEPAKPAKYVASIQYTEVQPITGPIYSYNSQPLTRIVRYAPLY